jgi:hypothetical protein
MSIENRIEQEVIPEILKVIEKHGVSIFMSEQIPSYLERAIKLENLRRTNEVMFKYYGQQEQ